MGVGAATSVVGGTMQAIAASQEQKAMFREYQKELQRQGAYRNEAMGSFGSWAPSLGLETARDQIGAGAANRMMDYAKVGDQSLMQGQGGNVRDSAYYNMTGANRAKLAGYGDWQNQQGISSEREGQALGKITNFAAGDAGVFPYRMYKAQHSMDELAFWGQMISSIGGGASNYAQLFGGTPQSPQFGQGPGSTPQNSSGFDFPSQQGVETPASESTWALG